MKCKLNSIFLNVKVMFIKIKTIKFIQSNTNFQFYKYAENICLFVYIKLEKLIPLIRILNLKENK